jgi:hypothetical protein
MLRRGAILSPGELWQMVLDFLLLPSIALTILVFAFLLTRTDPIPLLRDMAYQLSLRQNLSFSAAIPERLADNMEVISVLRSDTDGDGFEEWVVFYRYDLQTGDGPQAALGPIRAAVYDIDRGNPPVIFPYPLRPPDRDYLSEAPDSRLIAFDLVDVTLDQNGPDREDLLELMITNGDTLAFFRFRENSAPWDFPRDTPPRYQPIGYFQGSGGVTFDSDTKQVTVIDRDEYDRSQLALRSIYALQGDSYWAQVSDLGTDPASVALAAPIISTVDFFEEPPTDILDTEYPEKIVLGFYAATCGDVDDSLCIQSDTQEWEVNSFLTGEALSEYEAGRPGYFGLPSFAGNQDVSVSILRYYPQVELETSEPLVTGPQPQANRVDITFTEGGGPPQTASYEMKLVEGQWKIARRLVVQNPLASEPPSQISNP